MKSINWFNLLGFISAVSCLGLGLLFIWMGSQISHLTCTRLESSHVECRLQRRFLGLITVNQQSLPKVTAAELKENCTDGCLYWVELVTDEQAVSLTRFTSYNRGGVAAHHQQIVAFLNEPARPNFELNGSLSWLLLICSLPLLAVGSFLLKGFHPKQLRA